MRNTPLRGALALTLVLALAGLVSAPAAHAAGPASADAPTLRTAWTGLGERLLGWMSCLDGAFEPGPARMTAPSGSGMDPDGTPTSPSGGGMDPNGSPTPASGHGMDPNG